MTQVLAIIPARGGSKGVPGKNLRIIDGKPLIVHSIDQALAARAQMDIIVSTDDPEIASVARAAGANVPFMRPAELAKDTTPTEPVLLHALEHMENAGNGYDAVMLLQPTSPLRLSGTIDRAIDEFTNAGADSLVGVAETHAFHWWDGDAPTASYDYANRPRRQDIPPEETTYRETGSIYLTRSDILKRHRNRLAGRIHLFKMEPCETWEIDSELDFAILEVLMRKVRT